MNNNKWKNLDVLFNPSSVAVIGASSNPAKLGFHVMKSLTQGGFAGKIIPINPGTREIMGNQVYPSLIDYESTIDLAIVVVPAGLVAGVFTECAKKAVKGIVLITAGFKEIDDPAGTNLHEKIAVIANNSGIPVIGPNTFGMLASQSGGIAHLLGFLAMRGDVGFSKIIGLGNRLNVDFSEIIDYLSLCSIWKASITQRTFSPRSKSTSIKNRSLFTKPEARKKAIRQPNPILVPWPGNLKSIREHSARPVFYP